MDESLAELAAPGDVCVPLAVPVLVDSASGGGTFARKVASETSYVLAAAGGLAMFCKGKATGAGGCAASTIGAVVVASGWLARSGAWFSIAVFCVRDWRATIC
jgi:hypothetical protein